MIKTKKGSNAQFTSAGKGLTVIDNYAYAYSGDVSVGQPAKQMLLFQSPKEPIKGTLTMTKNNTDGDDYIYRLYFNGILVIGWANDYSAGGWNQVTMPIIIPPLTEVEVTAYNDTGDNGRNINASIVGTLNG